MEGGYIHIPLGRPAWTSPYPSTHGANRGHRILLYYRHIISNIISTASKAWENRFPRSFTASNRSSLTPRSRIKRIRQGHVTASKQWIRTSSQTEVKERDSVRRTIAQRLWSGGGKKGVNWSIPLYPNTSTDLRVRRIPLHPSVTGMRKR